MNILFLTCWYPSKNDPTNGIFIREHARAIKTNGENIVVLALNIKNGKSLFNRSIEKYTDEAGFETHIIHINSFLWKWIYSIPYFSSRFFKKYFLENISRYFSPDIIHSNIIYPCAIAGDRLASKLKKKHIITEHWSGVEKFMKKNPFSSFGKRAYKRAKAITAVSKFLRNKLIPYVGDPKKIKVIPNLIDNSVFYFENKKESDIITFTAIATWNRFKMPHLFTEALNEVSKTSLKKITLNFIGEGEYLEEIKKKKWNFKINYLGNLNRKNVASTLRASDFFLHASQIETFSIVTAEALLTGTPVVVSNVGALSELVDETDGVLTENTVPEWKTAIEKITRTSFNNKKISETNSNLFSPARIAQSFNDIYKKAN